MIVVCVILLRSPLAQLIPTLRNVEYRDLRLNFGKKLEELETAAEQAELSEIELESLRVALPHGTLSELVERLAEVSPRSAIAESWRHVEAALDDYFERRGVQMPRSDQVVGEALRSDDRVGDSAITLLPELRVLRNQAVHAGDLDLSARQAREYNQIAERIIAALQTASAGLGPPT